MNCHKKIKSPQKAFTVIEIIMVIVVVGILVAVAIPRFSSFYYIKLNGAIKKVVSDIRYVQQLAVSRHTNTRLVFDAVINTYTAQENNPAGSTTWVNIVNPFTKGNLSMAFNTDAQYKGIDITAADFGGTSTLRFTWEGVPQNSAGTNLASNGTITFFYQGSSFTIYVTPETGMVGIQ